MKKLTLLILFVSIFIAIQLQSSHANADILLEPYAGYSFGSESLTFTSNYSVAALRNYTNKGTINGLAYGARAAYTIPFGLYFGADYEGITGTEKMDLNNASYDWSQYTVYGLVGFRIPFLFTVRAGYGFLHQSTEKTTPSSTVLTGTAYKFGIGYNIIPLLAMNIDYSIYKLTNYTMGSASGSVSDIYSKADYSAIIVSLSVPLNF